VDVIQEQVEEAIALDFAQLLIVVSL